jgi:hypothetical protein
MIRFVEARITKNMFEDYEKCLKKISNAEALIKLVCLLIVFDKSIMNIQVLFSPLRGFYIRKNRKP